MAEDHDAVARTLEFAREVQEQGRFDRFDEFVHPDFHNHTAEPGRSADRAGAYATLTSLHAGLADVAIEIVHCFGHGDTVATNKVIRGRHVGDWLGQPPTGERVEFRVMDFLRFADGMIIEHWSTVRPLGPSSV